MWQQMAMENTVSIDFDPHLSNFDSFFDCRLPGVNKFDSINECMCMYCGSINVLQ